MEHQTQLRHHCRREAMLQTSQLSKMVCTLSCRKLSNYKCNHKLSETDEERSAATSIKALHQWLSFLLNWRIVHWHEFKWCMNSLGRTSSCALSLSASIEMDIQYVMWHAMRPSIPKPLWCDFWPPWHVCASVFLLQCLINFPTLKNSIPQWKHDTY